MTLVEKDSVAKEDDNRDLFRLQFKKTRLCSFYLEGRCRFGTECGFAHGDTQVEKPPDLAKTSLCAKWKQGQCNKSAAACMFAHGKHELRITPQFMRGRGKKKQAQSKQEKTAAPDTAKAQMPPHHSNTGGANAVPYSGVNSDMLESVDLQSDLGFGLWEDDISTPLSSLFASPGLPSTWMQEPMKVMVDSSVGESADLGNPIWNPTFDWEGDTNLPGSSNDGHSSRSQSPSSYELFGRKEHGSSAVRGNRLAIPGYSSFSGLPWNSFRAQI